MCDGAVMREVMVPNVMIIMIRKEPERASHFSAQKIRKSHMTWSNGDMTYTDFELGMSLNRATPTK